MSFSRITGLLIGMALLVSRPGVADEPAGRIAVRLAPGETNVFAGQKAQLDCIVRSQIAGNSKLFWSISVEQAVLARGEKALKLDPDRSVSVPIEMQFPELRPGVVSPGALSLDVQSQDGSQTQQTVELHVFSPDVLANRKQWVKSIEISLFDPAKRTRETFEKLGIPVRTLSDADGSRANRLIVYGEGLEAARQKAVWQQAMIAATAGKKVIVLASSGATVPMESVFATGDNQPSSVSLRRADRIREFDKRLESDAWPKPGRIVASSMSLLAKGQTPVAELRDDASGWTWLDVSYANGGRLIWTGHGIIESWESTPAARYLLVKILEELTIESTEMGGLKREAQ